MAQLGGCAERGKASSHFVSSAMKIEVRRISLTLLPRLRIYVRSSIEDTGPPAIILTVTAITMYWLLHQVCVRRYW